MLTKQQNKMLAGKQDRDGMPVHETGRGRTEMEESKELLALLREIREHEAEQKRYARKQFYMSFITAVCSGTILALVSAAYLSVVPHLRSTLNEARTAAKELGEVSAQLSGIDFKGMAEHMDELVATSESGVNDALEKLNAIDIEKLNHAIQGLADVVSPFARFMELFD